MIVPFILVNLMFDLRVILSGETEYWSLLEVKGWMMDNTYMLRKWFYENRVAFVCMLEIPNNNFWNHPGCLHLLLKFKNPFTTCKLFNFYTFLDNTIKVISFNFFRPWKILALFLSTLRHYKMSAEKRCPQRRHPHK